MINDLLLVHIILLVVIMSNVDLDLYGSESEGEYSFLEGDVAASPNPDEDDAGGVRMQNDEELQDPENLVRKSRRFSIGRVFFQLVFNHVCYTIMSLIIRF